MSRETRQRSRTRRSCPGGLRDVGVTRATLYAPSAGTKEVLRFLDDVAPLVDETKAA
jgi:hypothetical protein